MELVYTNLYIGNAADARDIPLLKMHKVNAVLNVAMDLQYFIDKDTGIVQYKVGMTDGMHNPPELFYAAVLTLKGLLEHNRTVLIHCHEGRSRSPSVVAAYLGIKEGKSYFEKLNELKSIRSKVNPEPGMMEFASNCMPWLEEVLKI